MILLCVAHYKNGRPLKLKSSISPCSNLSTGEDTWLCYKLILSHGNKTPQITLIELNTPHTNCLLRVSKRSYNCFKFTSSRTFVPFPQTYFYIYFLPLILVSLIPQIQFYASFLPSLPLTLVTTLRPFCTRPLSTPSFPPMVNSHTALPGLLRMWRHCPRCFSCWFLTLVQCTRWKAAREGQEYIILDKKFQILLEWKRLPLKPAPVTNFPS